MGLLEAPLRVLHFVGEGLWREMVVNGGPIAWLETPGMDSHHLQFPEELDGIVCGLEPEMLMDQTKWYGIIGFFKLDMAVAMDLYLGPCSQLGRYIGKGPKKRFFGFNK